MKMSSTDQVFAQRVVGYFIKVRRKRKFRFQSKAADQRLIERAMSSITRELEKTGQYPTNQARQLVYKLLAGKAAEKIKGDLQTLVGRTVQEIQQRRASLKSPPKLGTPPSTRSRELRQELDRSWKNLKRSADASLSETVGGRLALECLLTYSLEQQVDELFTRSYRDQPRQVRFRRVHPPVTQPQSAYCWDTAPHAVRTANDDDVVRPFPPWSMRQRGRLQKEGASQPKDPSGQLTLW